MQLRCTNCHKPFALSKDEINIALDTIHAEELWPLQCILPSLSPCKPCFSARTPTRRSRLATQTTHRGNQFIISKSERSTGILITGIII